MEGIEKIAGVVVGSVVLLIVAGYLVVKLWPVTYDISGNMTAMTGTDAGTDIFQALWPVLLIIVAIVVIVGMITWSLRKLRE